MLASSHLLWNFNSHYLYENCSCCKILKNSCPLGQATLTIWLPEIIPHLHPYLTGKFILISYNIHELTNKAQQQNQCVISNQNTKCGLLIRRF